METIKAVVFDLYNTLIYNLDTNPYLRLFSELALSPDDIMQTRRIALTEDFEDLHDFVQRIKPGARINLQPYEEEVAQGVKSTTTFPETKIVLEELIIRRFKCGLISNLASAYKAPFFELGLNAYFDEVFFSCEIGLKKPDPRIYQKMMEKLHVNPVQAIMIGDKVPADVDGPKAIGMNAVHLDRTNTSLHSISTLEGVFQFI